MVAHFGRRFDLPFSVHSATIGAMEVVSSFIIAGILAIHAIAFVRHRPTIREQSHRLTVGRSLASELVWILPLGVMLSASAALLAAAQVWLAALLFAVPTIWLIRVLVQVRHHHVLMIDTQLDLATTGGEPLARASEIRAIALTEPDRPVTLFLRDEWGRLTTHELPEIPGVAAPTVRTAIAEFLAIPQLGLDFTPRFAEGPLGRGQGGAHDALPAPNKTRSS
jgi:hypothetical protein